ncbi:hypothetical protein Pmani_009243 [Petrolisthes manimaculis]|uniref:Ribonuclease P/MRP protein subunit POP5 n=1 Tax=Petrolisthes manimaculis TaxID=1843537 RepID=A0AAE1Q573_9EUCA|nr:hypothetical protein Pmani_009243 [Petrolisthes manimaculis]
MVRFKKRYLVVEVVPKKRRGFNWKGLQEAIVLAVKKMHGDFGVGATSSGFRVKYQNKMTLMAFISAARGPHRLVASALPFITEVGGQPATVHSLYLAGCMRHAFIFLKNHHLKKLKEMEKHISPSERKKWKSELPAASR